VESTACGHHYGRRTIAPLLATSDRCRNVPSQSRAFLDILTTHFGNVAWHHRGTGGGGGGGDSPGDPWDRDRDWRQGEISKARLVPQRPPFRAIVMRSYHLVVSGYSINACRTSRSESSLAPRRPQPSAWSGALGASVSTSSVDTTTWSLC
jgi:hypothetical protein